MKQKKMLAILAEPGKEPQMLELPAAEPHHDEAIRDALGGNYGAVEFFRLEKGVSLFLLVNDLAAVLELPPNRRFPPPDEAQIIFGNVIFILAYNGETEREGTLGMAPALCQMFIEQIKKNFQPCNGTEKPRPEDTVYYDNQGTAEEFAYRWLETDKPGDAELGEPIAAGRVKFYQRGELMEAGGRFFKKVEIYTKDTPLR